MVILREEGVAAGQQGRRGAATVGRNARRRGYLCGSLYKYLADCLLCGAPAAAAIVSSTRGHTHSAATPPALSWHTTLLVFSLSFHVFCSRESTANAVRWSFMSSSESRIASSRWILTGRYLWHKPFFVEPTESSQA